MSLHHIFQWLLDVSLLFIYLTTEKKTISSVSTKKKVSLFWCVHRRIYWFFFSSIFQFLKTYPLPRNMIYAILSLQFSFYYYYFFKNIIILH